MRLAHLDWFRLADDPSRILRSLPQLLQTASSNRSFLSRATARASFPARFGRERSLVFFLIHLRCGTLIATMTTPLSDDAMGSLDKVSPRHVFETRIQIVLQRDSARLSLQGWARNLSESGMGAFVAEALILDESVTLEIPLPDCDKQVIPAKVVRAMGTEYGFQFTALSAEQRQQIRATLEERPAIPYPGAGR